MTTFNFVAENRLVIKVVCSWSEERNKVYKILMQASQAVNYKT